MFDEPENHSAEVPRDPATRAREKSDEFRMHAELAAVFEAPRKFDARLIPGLDFDLARDIQRTMARLEKSKTPESPILPPTSAPDAATLLDMPAAKDLSTSDYHIHRRPGEVMIVRWLAGHDVETFYTRLQAHFDAALEGFRDDERSAHGWKQDPSAAAYLKALEAIELKVADRYLREPIRAHNLFVLSTQTADEININYLAEDIMGRSAEELVGPASAPPQDAATEQDLAWFFKLFSLRGVREGVEQMCFFTFLQKSDDNPW
jgi:hypothetical protein